MSRSSRDPSSFALLEYIVEPADTSTALVMRNGPTLWEAVMSWIRPSSVDVLTRLFKHYVHDDHTHTHSRPNYSQTFRTNVDSDLSEQDAADRKDDMAQSEKDVTKTVLDFVNASDAVLTQSVEAQLPLFSPTQPKPDQEEKNN